MDAGHIKMRVYERAAAETLACGMGACAAMAVFIHWQEVNETVTISLLSGDLSDSWSGVAAGPVWMTGPVTTVFEGTIIDG